MNSSTGRRVCSVIGVMFALSLLAGGLLLQPDRADGRWISIKAPPVVAISPNPVPFDRKAKVMIAGAGFEPNQEVRLIIVTGGGLTGITYLVKPAPVANEFGAFASEWTPGRMLRTLEPTAYTLRIVDENGTVLTQAPLAFEKKQKKEKKK